MMRTSLALLFVLCTTTAQAQDWTAGTIMRAVEVPNHTALLAHAADPNATLAPFETDGCSGGLSSAWKIVAGSFPDFEQTHRSAPPWENCCVTHDQAYHNAGGTGDANASFNARLTADRALQSCVIATGTQRADTVADTYNMQPDQIKDAYESIGNAMFLAVRFGGAPCSGLPWRWGYGYPSCSVLSPAFD